MKRGMANTCVKKPPLYSTSDGDNFKYNFVYGIMDSVVSFDRQRVLFLVKNHKERSQHMMKSARKFHTKIVLYFSTEIPNVSRGDHSMYISLKTMAIISSPNEYK